MSGYSNPRIEDQIEEIENNFAQARHTMVEQQLRQRNIRDQSVLDAMNAVPRHLFVDMGQQADAYSDQPLTIAEGQTISQPYIVATTAEAAELSPSDRVLEVGTGSGYSAAVLSYLCREVYTIERHPSLTKAAKERISACGRRNIKVRCGDGTLGWPEVAPFDAILVTATGPEVPKPLLAQLRRGGRLIMPVGKTAHTQELIRVDHLPDGRFESRSLMLVRFVPLIGKDGWPENMS